MTPSVPIWWTDERVEETVNPEYIFSHLRPNEQLLLKQSPSFAAGLTDDTYLDWVLTRAKRFFLILVDVGVPDQIFGIVDDSYDDEDLPISEDVVQDLRLSLEPNRSLDKRFYKTQFRYLIRVVEDGEHIRYAQEETVPVYPLGLKSTVVTLGKNETDKVRLPNDMVRVFTRKRMPLDEKTTEHSVLQEIASARHFAHEHLVSIFGSYLFDDSVYLLMTPTSEYSLKSFLSDVPKVFDNLPKPERRRILINWPHCLAHGVAWLHSNGRPHASIRPSNIQIDERFNICLGSFDGAGTVGSSNKIDDVEAYQYAAPERWRRAVTVQTSGPAKMSGHSGGRTARKVPKEELERKRLSWQTESRVATDNPTSIGYAFMPTAKGNFTRLRLGKANSDDMSIASERFTESRQSDLASINTGRVSHRTTRSDAPSALSEAHSGVSYASSGSNRTVKAVMMNSIFVAAPDVRTAVVQTWQSSQFDLFAADMFSLGAIILDILTVLCKRSISSFIRHRSSKNRTPGRGGGLADASFHANLGQVMAWANTLQDDAKKKAKKEDGKAYGAVGPVLQLVKLCMDREPEQRLSAKEFEKRAEEYVLAFSGLHELHCRREVSGGSRSPTMKRAMAKALPERPLSPPATLSDKQSMENFSYREPIAISPPREDEWTKLRSKGLVTATIPPPGPPSAFSSMSSFNFENDVNSVTVVEDDRSHVTTEPSEGYRSRPVTADSRDQMKKLKAKSKRTETWNNWRHNNSETFIDPSLAASSPASEQQSFMNLHDATSSDDEHAKSAGTFLLPSSRPSSMFPDKTDFPAVPTYAQPSSHDDQRERRRKQNMATTMKENPPTMPPLPYPIPTAPLPMLPNQPPAGPGFGPRQSTVPTMTTKTRVQRAPPPQISRSAAAVVAADEDELWLNQRMGSSKLPDRTR